MSGWVSSGEFFGFAMKKNMEKPWFLVWERDESHIITGKTACQVYFFLDLWWRVLPEDRAHAPIINPKSRAWDLIKRLWIV